MSPYFSINFRIDEENFCYFNRQLTGDNSYITVANIGDDTETIDLSNTSKLPDSLQYYTVSVSSNHKPGYVKLSFYYGEHNRFINSIPERP